eukprot:TRINITY_DN24372_c0_g1_i1.p1 TRINITY_DN24372_c0_g1~~TRINITY_DN24372_c0_g1_i1.p1  ORF type:complete len:687 (-),score=118.37 TRINITY_DN24372_c0_g1_i1:167-2227(-)
MAYERPLLTALIVLRYCDLGAQGNSPELEPDFDDELWRPPPFFDYDCDLADFAPTAPQTSWNQLFEWVNETVSHRVRDPHFELRDEDRRILSDPVVAQAERECPLGVLYLRVLNFYDTLLDGNFGPALVPHAAAVERILRRFPVYAIALSRWPIFKAMDHYAHLHKELEALYCDGNHEVLDWAELRQLSLAWASMKRGYSDGQGLEELELRIADQFFTVLKSTTNQNAAAEACPWGFNFLVANQVVAAANKDSHYMPPFVTIMDNVLQENSFMKIAASGWPIFAVLDIFADLNKGIWFFGGDRKYLRGYSDWNLRRDELSPLQPAGAGRPSFLSEPWKDSVAASVNVLVAMSWDRYIAALWDGLARREAEEGRVARPIVRSLVEAAVAIARSSGNNEAAGGRRLVYVVLLYGASWAGILERLARRFKQLALPHPLLAISIGVEASEACQSIAKLTSETAGERLLCWTPGSKSQVHRFTAIHALLHLGIDVIYMDMDTFMLRDPTPRILAAAEGYDALFASHADGDCINIGVFYLRASGDTAVWFSQFVAWYHDHPFEVDQRGLHVFLGLPAQQLRIAYPPPDLVKIRGGILDDVNEVVIGDVGWYGNMSRMLIFHWCHRPIEQKEDELRTAYDAGDAASTHGLSLAAAVTTAIRARPGSNWARVLDFRAVLESYQKDSVPIREACW